MCKFRPGSGFFLRFTCEIEERHMKAKEKRGDIREFQGLNLLFVIFYTLSYYDSAPYFD